MRGLVLSSALIAFIVVEPSYAGSELLQAFAPSCRQNLTFLGLLKSELKELARTLGLVKGIADRETYKIESLKPAKDFMVFRSGSVGGATERQFLSINEHMDFYLGVVDRPNEDLLVFLFFDTPSGLRFPVGFFRFVRQGEKYSDWRWEFNLDEKLVENQHHIVQSAYQEHRNMFWSDRIGNAFDWLKKQKPALFSNLSDRENKDRLPSWW